MDGVVIDERYELIRRLGSGGSADVFAARDLLTAQPVAVKLLRKDQLDGSAPARLEREARLARSLAHPNLVRALAFGQDPRTGPYLVMELLSGRTLEQEMQRAGPLSLSNTLHWLGPIAAALQALHAEGLTHRDVKPANILRAEDAASSRVKLVDLGLASFRDRRDRVTRAGQLMGTAEYLAPELAEGEGGTASSDIYSLAAVAFECLTGRLPHEAKSPIRVLALKLTEPAARLADRSDQRFPEHVGSALASALDRDPARRPTTAPALIERLLEA